MSSLWRPLLRRLWRWLTWQSQRSQPPDIGRAPARHAATIQLAARDLRSYPAETDIQEATATDMQEETRLPI
jgi:hypothetical protein